jgi:hypothetical protein
MVLVDLREIGQSGLQLKLPIEPKYQQLHIQPVLAQPNLN